MSAEGAQPGDDGRDPVGLLGAQLGAIAGLASREGVDVLDAEAVAVSFPGFFDLLDTLAQR